MDMANSDTTFDPNRKEDIDAGSVARDKLAARVARKTARVVKVILAVLSAILIGAIIAVGIFTYQRHVIVTDSYYKACKWQVGEMLVTGQRTYTTKARSIFGFNLTDTSATVETTRITVPKSGLTIVGGTVDDKWWAEVFDAGDIGAKDLKPAVSYTFVNGRNIAMVKYDSFCK